MNPIILPSTMDKYLDSLGSSAFVRQPVKKKKKQTLNWNLLNSA